MLLRLRGCPGGSHLQSTDEKTADSRTRQTQDKQTRVRRLLDEAAAVQDNQQQQQREQAPVFCITFKDRFEVLTLIIVVPSCVVTAVLFDLCRGQLL
jgi:hypothetical protein